MSPPVGRRGGDRYLVLLAVLFGLEWIALAINPRNRQDWALENALSVAFVAALVMMAVLTLLAYGAGEGH